jgi:hypothetical protein
MRTALPEQVPKPAGAIRFWVIYDHPRDAPHAYVLRAQLVIDGAVVPDFHNAWYADDPDKLRSILPPGVVMMPIDEPNPVILETWME